MVRSEDLDAIYTLLTMCPGAAIWSKTGLEEICARYPSHSLVARDGEEILGFIAGRTVADEGEILNLAVQPCYRRRGVGKALAEGLLKGFSQAGVARVFLEVRESNRGALAFYFKLGFQPVGRREGYYHQPDEAAVILAVDCR